MYMYVHDGLTSNEEQTSVSDHCVVYTEVLEGYQCCSGGGTGLGMVSECQQNSTTCREAMPYTQLQAHASRIWSQHVTEVFYLVYGRTYPDVRDREALDDLIVRCSHFTNMVFGTASFIKGGRLPATLCIPVSVNLVLLRERVVRVAMDTILATPTSET